MSNLCCQIIIIIFIHIASLTDRQRRKYMWTIKPQGEKVLGIQRHFHQFESLTLFFEPKENYWRGRGHLLSQGVAFLQFDCSLAMLGQPAGAEQGLKQPGIVTGSLWPILWRGKGRGCGSQGGSMKHRAMKVLTLPSWSNFGRGRFGVGLGVWPMGRAASRKEGLYWALMSRDWRGMEWRRDHFRGMRELEGEIRGEYFSEKPIILHGPQKWPCTRIQEPLAPGQYYFCTKPKKGDFSAHSSNISARTPQKNLILCTIE